MRESTTKITSREMPMPFQFLSGPIGPMSFKTQERDFFNNDELSTVNDGQTHKKY